MEIPKGYNKEEIQKVIDDWNKLYDEVKNGTFPIDDIDYEFVYKDILSIDRTLRLGNANFIIVSDILINCCTYLHEYVTLNKNGAKGIFSIEQLKEIVNENINL